MPCFSGRDQHDGEGQGDAGDYLAGGGGFHGFGLNPGGGMAITLPIGFTKAGRVEDATAMAW